MLHEFLASMDCSFLKCLGRTFHQEFEHFKGLEQSHRVSETERRVDTSILKHVCKYFRRTELFTGKDASSFCLLIRFIKQDSSEIC